MIADLPLNSWRSIDSILEVNEGKAVLAIVASFDSSTFNFTIFAESLSETLLEFPHFNLYFK